MKERKPSFLERLTGTRVVGEGGSENERSGGNVLSEKPWSSRIDNTGVTSVADAVSAEEQRSENSETTVDEDAVEPEQAEETADEEEAGLAIYMYESDNELIIQSMIAGVTPENLHIAITREMVTIKGKRVAPEGIPEEHRLEQELYWGPFSREIPLPFEIDTDGAEAVEKYGLLVIRLPKLDFSKTQELKVKSIE